MAELLYTTKYVKPGAYIGQLIEPSSTDLPSAARIPTAIGKGSRLAQSSNAVVTRAYVYDETISFSSSSPYNATLLHPAIMNQDLAQLIRVSDGSVIIESHWSFVDANTITLYEEEYDSGEFTFSYQSSDSNVLDPAPVDDIRQFVCVGDTMDSNKYKEGRDFYLEMELSEIVEKGTTVVSTDLEFDQRYSSESLYPVVTPVTKTGTGNGTLAINLADFSDLGFNSTATFTVEEVTLSGSDLASVTFSYEYQSSITGNLAGGTVVIPVTIDTETYQNVLVALSTTSGSLSSTSFVVADTFTYTIIAGKIFTSAKDNRNVTLKLTQKATVVKAVTAIGDGSKVVAVDTDAQEISFGSSAYSIAVGDVGATSFDANVTYFIDATHTQTEKITVAAVNGLIGASDVIVTLSTGMKITFKTAQTFVEGNSFTFTYTVTGTTSWYYSSDTPEGGFGTVSYTGLKGVIILPGNLLVVADATSLTVEDEFTFSLANLNTISWDLTQRTSQSFKTTEVYRDINGSITGVTGTYYVALDGAPLGSIATSGLGAIVATIVTSEGENTSYVAFSAKPSVQFTITYEYKGTEPAVGSSYYVTTLHLRPADYYNVPKFISSRAEGQKLLGPATPTNDLYTANEIAWDEIGNASGYNIAIIQIMDSDDDGSYTPDDVKRAIDATASSKKLTDYTLLSFPSQLAYLLKANQDGNDPFVMRENEVWHGASIGTSVGDVETEGTIVYIAKNSLKVTGDDPCHGTRMMVGSTWVTRSVTMYSGKSQTVTMDGSFIAWAIAAHRSAMGAADSILRKTLTAFATMEIQSDTDNDILGENQVIYFSKQGEGIYRIEEDFTTDNYSSEFELEQITSQRLTVVRRVRKYLDDSLVGMTPDTPQSGVNTITGYLVRALTLLVKEGVIAPYQDNGVSREIDPEKDIFVTYVKDNPTQYQFGYGFYTKKVTKQLFGIYVVDKNFADTGLGNS